MMLFEAVLKGISRLVQKSGDFFAEKNFSVAVCCCAWTVSDNLMTVSHSWAHFQSAHCHTAVYKYAL